MSSRNFDARTIGTITTGIVLNNGFDGVQEAISHMVGHDVWTHEMADRDQNDRIRQAILAQYPDLPVKVVDGDFEGLSAKLLSDYPDGIDLEGGLEIRSKSPIDSLLRLRG